MAPFIRTIKGKIALLDGNKKKISLLVKENLADTVMEKKLDFNLDPHVRITNRSQQPMELGGIKTAQNVEIGYSSNKSKMTVSYIKIIS